MRLHILLALLLIPECFAAGIGVSPDRIYFEDKQAQIVVFNPNNEAYTIEISADNDIFDFTYDKLIEPNKLTRVIVKQKKPLESQIDIRLLSNKNGFTITPAVSVKAFAEERKKKYKIKELNEEQQTKEPSELSIMLKKIPIPVKGTAVMFAIVIVGVCCYFVVRRG